MFTNWEEWESAGNRCSESKQYMYRQARWSQERGPALFEFNVNCVDAFVDCLSHCLIACLFVWLRWMGWRGGEGRGREVAGNN